MATRTSVPAKATKRKPKRAAAPTDASTRDHIVQTALECFALHGFEGSSTRTISTAAGVNQGLIPYYFGSKQKLWQEAVDRAFGELHAAVGAIADAVEAEPTRDDVARLVRRYVEFVAAHPEFVLLMNEEGKRPGARMRWIVDRHTRPVFEALGKLFERVRKQSGFPGHVDVVHLSYIFVGAVATIFHQAPECERSTGYNPLAAEAVAAHADAIVHLFLGDAALGRS